MSAGDYPDWRDSGPRRMRVACKHCGASVEIAGLREHLRASHNLDSATVESSYLAALMDVRRARRSRF